MILIIGYGNPLRSDDAIGQHIAQAMQQRLRHTRLQVHTTYQLVPELANLISTAELVIFIDAQMGGTPGEVLPQIIAPAWSVGSLTHHVTPGGLLAASCELYGKTPRGILISIVGAAFHFGCELSPELQQMLPTITDQVKAIIESSAQVRVYEEADRA
jgi:hydrogenase maturation protease